MASDSGSSQPLPMAKLAIALAALAGFAIFVIPALFPASPPEMQPSSPTPQLPSSPESEDSGNGIPPAASDDETEEQGVCSTDQCMWGEVLAISDHEALGAGCQLFESPANRDMCNWFAAGVSGDASFCGNFTDAKYRPLCTREVNGQLSCSPSACANCVSKEACGEFPTCAYSPSDRKCSQASMLANPALPAQGAPRQVY